MIPREPDLCSGPAGAMELQQSWPSRPSRWVARLRSWASHIPCVGWLAPPGVFIFLAHERTRWSGRFRTPSDGNDEYVLCEVRLQPRRTTSTIVKGASDTSRFWYRSAGTANEPQIAAFANSTASDVIESETAAGRMRRRQANMTTIGSAAIARYAIGA